MIALFITLMQQSRRCYSSPFVVFQIKSLRAAYRKIFMPSEGNLVGIEDRLTELVLHQYKTRIFSYYLYSSCISYNKKRHFQENDDELGRIPAVSLMVQSVRDSFAEDRRGICKFRSWSGS